MPGNRLVVFCIVASVLSVSCLSAFPSASQAAESWDGQDKKHHANLRGFFLYGIPMGEGEARASANGDAGCTICGLPWPIGCTGFDADFAGRVRTSAEASDNLRYIGLLGGVGYRF